MQRAISNEAAVFDYRRRNLIFWLLFLGFVPGILYVAAPLGRLLNSDGVSQLISFAWFAGVAAAAIWRLNYVCAHCGEKFYTKWWYKNAFTTKCVHCHLRPTDTDPQSGIYGD